MDSFNKLTNYRTINKQQMKSANQIKPKKLNSVFFVVQTDYHILAGSHPNSTKAMIHLLTIQRLPDYPKQFQKQMIHERDNQKLNKHSKIDRLIQSEQLGCKFPWLECEKYNCGVISCENIQDIKSTGNINEKVVRPMPFNYQQGMILMEQGQYAEAIVKFQNSVNYCQQIDSDIKCYEKIVKCLYRIAQSPSPFMVQITDNILAQCLEWASHNHLKHLIHKFKDTNIDQENRDQSVSNKEKILLLGRFSYIKLLEKVIPHSFIQLYLTTIFNTVLQRIQLLSIACASFNQQHAYGNKYLTERLINISDNYGMNSTVVFILLILTLCIKEETLKLKLFHKYTKMLDVQLKIQKIQGGFYIYNSQIKRKISRWKKILSTFKLTAKQKYFLVLKKQQIFLKLQQWEQLHKLYPYIFYESQFQQKFDYQFRLTDIFRNRMSQISQLQHQILLKHILLCFNKFSISNKMDLLKRSVQWIPENIEKILQELRFINISKLVDNIRKHVSKQSPQYFPKQCSQQKERVEIDFDNPGLGFPGFILYIDGLTVYKNSKRQEAKQKIYRKTNEKYKNRQNMHRIKYFKKKLINQQSHQDDVLFKDSLLGQNINNFIQLKERRQKQFKKEKEKFNKRLFIQISQIQWLYYNNLITPQARQQYSYDEKIDISNIKFYLMHLLEKCSKQTAFISKQENQLKFKINQQLSSEQNRYKSKQLQQKQITIKYLQLKIQNLQVQQNEKQQTEDINDLIIQTNSLVTNKNPDNRQFENQSKYLSKNQDIIITESQVKQVQKQSSFQIFSFNSSQTSTVYNNSLMSAPITQIISLQFQVEPMYYQKSISLPKVSTFFNTKDSQFKKSIFYRQFRQLRLNNHAHLINYLSNKRKHLQWVPNHYFEQFSLTQTRDFNCFVLKVDKGEMTFEQSIKSSNQPNPFDVLIGIKSLIKGIIELQIIGVYHQDLQLRNMVRFNDRQSRQYTYKIIDFDYAFAILNEDDKQYNSYLHEVNNGNLILAWLQQEQKQKQSTMLEHLLKSIFEPQNKAFKDKLYRIKRAFSPKLKTQAIKLMTKIIEDYMYCSHKQQFIVLLKQILMMEKERKSRSILPSDVVERIVGEGERISNGNNSEDYQKLLVLIERQFEKKGKSNDQ